MWVKRVSVGLAALLACVALSMLPQSMAAQSVTRALTVAISTGVTGLGTGVATFLGTPSSANLATALTDETGTGTVLFGNQAVSTTSNPTFAALTVTSCTGCATASGWGLAASVASNILTVALVTESGATPTGAAPVTLKFRDVTDATGSWSSVAVSAATTVAVPDTALLGTSNSVPFHAWIVAFNDAGTIRLGIINCAGSGSVYPLGGWGIASSTTIGTGSDSAQVFYSDAGVTSKAYVVLGYLSYESGLATAGTWSAAPTRAQAYTMDVPLPGRAVQTVITNYATQTASTSSTYADTGSTATITPTSAANRVIVRAGVGGVYKDTADQSVNIQLLRTATQLGFQRAGANAATGANGVGSVAFTVLDHPQSSSAITYKTQFAAGGNTNNVYVQQGSSQSYIELTEVMQ